MAIDPAAVATDDGDDRQVALSGVNIPDGATPIVGWRAWSPVLLTLRSWVMESWWQVGWNNAGCGLNTFTRAPDGLCQITGRPPPAERCRCGFYATRSALDLVGQVFVPAHNCTCPACKFDTQRPAMIGRVELSGHYVEYDAGWRAQRARIVGPLHPVHLGHSVAYQLARRYGVELGKPVRNMYALCEALKYNSIPLEWGMDSILEGADVSWKQ